MPRPHSVPPPRFQRDRGAVIVEFALVLPVMAMMIFGMLEFGIAFNNKSALTQGTREGARQGSVADFGSNNSCTIIGASPNTETRKFACLVKSRAELEDAQVRVKIDFVTTNDAGEQLIVCSMYPIQSITGFFGPMLSGKNLEAKVETRIEKKDANLQELTEAPPSGGDWSFCS